MSDANCPYCGVLMDKGGKENARTKDHFYPLSRGGTVTVFACRKCNGDKGALSPSEWLSVLEGAGDPRAKDVAWFMASHARNIDQLEANGVKPLNRASQVLAEELAPYVFPGVAYADCTNRQQFRLISIANSVLRKISELDAVAPERSVA